MKIKWRCSCGFAGESDIGCWMRCDNAICKKNAFQIIDFSENFLKEKNSFEARLLILEEKLNEVLAKLKGEKE